jgi:hypothetical protein
VRLWVADEHRYGLIPVVRKCWTLRGVRPTVPYRTKYEWGYLDWALEVDGRNAAEFLCLPEVSLEMSGLFLNHLAASDPAAEHVVIWDQAGFIPNPNGTQCRRGCIWCRYRRIVQNSIRRKPSATGSKIGLAMCCGKRWPIWSRPSVRNCVRCVKMPKTCGGWSHTPGWSNKQTLPPSRIVQLHAQSGINTLITKIEHDDAAQKYHQSIFHIVWCAECHTFEVNLDLIFRWLIHCPA